MRIRSKVLPGRLLQKHQLVRRSPATTRRPPDGGRKPRRSTEGAKYDSLARSPRIAKKTRSRSEGPLQIQRYGNARYGTTRRRTRSWPRRVGRPPRIFHEKCVLGLSPEDSAWPVPSVRANTLVAAATTSSTVTACIHRKSRGHSRRKHGLHST